MPTVRAGQLPAAMRGYRPVKGLDKHIVNHRSSRLNDGLEWDLSGGWHPQKPEGWTQDVKHSYRTLIDFNGNKVKVFYDKSSKYEGLGFHPHQEDEQAFQDRMAFAEAAFDTSKTDVGKIYTAEGSEEETGHIAKLEYAEREQILRVTFRNDAVCLFFRVPTQVAGLLYHLAKNHTTAGVYTYGSKKGRIKHALGVNFWNYIRIRGRQTGAKYPFEYEKHGTYKLTGSNARYTVRIDASSPEVLALFGGPERLKTLNSIRPFEDGEKVSIVVTQDELDKYRAYLAAQATEAQNKELAKDEKTKQEYEKQKKLYGSYGDTASKLGSQDLQEFIKQKYAIDADDDTSDEPSTDEVVTSKPKRQVPIEAAMALDKELTTQMEAWKTGLVNRIDELLKREDLARIREGVELANIGQPPSFVANEVIKTLLAVTSDDPDAQRILKAVYRRDGNYLPKPSLDDMGNMGKLAYLNGENVQTWQNKAIPAKRAGLVAGRYWTKSQLEDMADPKYMDGADLITYTGYIASGDYHNALNFLKHVAKPREIVDGRTGKRVKNVGNWHYAQSNDKLSLDIDD